MHNVFFKFHVVKGVSQNSIFSLLATVLYVQDAGCPNVIIGITL